MSLSIYSPPGPRPRHPPRAPLPGILILSDRLLHPGPLLQGKLPPRPLSPSLLPSHLHMSMIICTQLPPGPVWCTFHSLPRVKLFINAEWLWSMHLNSYSLMTFWIAGKENSWEDPYPWRILWSERYAWRRVLLPAVACSSGCFASCCWYCFSRLSDLSCSMNFSAAYYPTVDFSRHDGLCIFSSPVVSS